jgi:RHS repeat-associated protein
VLGPDEGNALQYTGRENDGTGLYYYRARYYDPGLKRFISSDPIGSAGGINLYMYVSGDPLSRTDPFGLTDGEASGSAQELLLCDNKLPSPKICLGIEDCRNKCWCEHVQRMAECRMIDAACRLRSKQRLELCVQDCIQKES